MTGTYDMEAAMNEEQKALLRKGVEYVEAQEALPQWERQWWQAAWYLPESEWDSFRRYLAQAQEAKRRGIRFSDVEQPQLAACGSAHCLFGYMAEVDGQEWEGGESSRNGYLANGEFVQDYIARRLGLDDDQAEDLSAPGNDAKKIRRLAEQYAGERL